jgi:hypothetical protein
MKGANSIPFHLIAFTKLLIRTFLLFFLLHSCSGTASVKETSNENEINSVTTTPTAVAQAIRIKFPGAVSYQEEIDSLLIHLKKYGIKPENMLWGQSTCVDDIINTKNKLPAGVKGPFNFGGLAGLPFTGITGINAFSHHIPEDGTAMLFVGPHIGYNEKEGWGKILRHDQHHTTSCCGALVAALTKLQKGELKSSVPSADDFQQGVIEQLAFTHRNEILSSPDPLVLLTQLAHREAAREIADYASKVTERHFKYAVVVAGIIINTDYMFADYLWIQSISILDVQKNIWVEGGKLVKM